MRTNVYTGFHVFNPMDIKGHVPAEYFRVRHEASACFSMWPCEFCARYENERLELEARLFGQKVGEGFLDRNHPSATFGVEIGIGKISLTATADFTEKELTLDGEVCVRTWAGGWQCSKIHAVILRWS